MSYTLAFTTQFKRDFKTCKKNAVTPLLKFKKFFLYRRLKKNYQTNIISINFQAIILVAGSVT